MVDLSQYSTEELESMLGEGAKTPSPSSDLSKYSDKELQSMLGGEKPKHPGLAGTVAAGLRGVRESIPFGQDIGAVGTYMLGNPLTGEKDPESFEEAKRQQVKRDEQLFAEHPLAYGSGFVGGTGAQMLAEGPLALAQATERKIASKVAPYAGETAGRLAGVAGTGAATGALYGAGEGVTPEERLAAMEHGAGMGAALGLGAEGITKGLQKAGLIGRGAAPEPLKVTSKNLHEEATKAYNAADSAGLAIKKDAVKNFYNDVMRKLGSENFRSNRNSELNDAISELYQLTKKPEGTINTTYAPIKFSNLDVVNQFAADAIKSPNDQTRRLGAIFRDELQDFLHNLTPADISAGDKKKAMESLKNARDLWTRKKKIDDITDLFTAADIEAGKPSSSRGVGDILKNKLSDFVKKIETGKGPRRWTDDEIKTMRELAESHKVLGKAASFDPTKSKGSAITAIITAMHNPLIGGVGAGAAYGARHLSEALALEKFQQLQDLIAAGGKHHLVRRGPKPSVSSTGTTLRQAVTPFFSTQFGAENTPMGQQDREAHAAGGKVGKRDYPAKRLNRLERAARRAQQDIALETKPILNQPDAMVAKALEIANGVNSE